VLLPGERLGVGVWRGYAPEAFGALSGPPRSDAWGGWRRWRARPGRVDRIYFFSHFRSRTSPIVPPEMISPFTGFPRNIILVVSSYAFEPVLFQALHGVSMRHSLNVLAVQLKV
jgi:hypothetical protein